MSKKPDDFEETQQIRVRAKNPQIGRKRSEPMGEDPTVNADALTVRPSNAFADEEQTEIAVARPVPELLQRPSVPQRPSVSVIKSTVPRLAPDRGATAADRGPTKKVVQPPDQAPTERPSAAKPRARMEQLGTDGVGLLAQKAKIARAEARTSVTQSPLLKPYRGVIEDRALAALDRVLAGELEGDSEPHASPKRALERVVHAPELARLATDERARLLATIGASPREIETMRAAARLLEKAPLTRLATSERGMLFELFALLRPPQQSVLADIAERPLHGKTALEDRDLHDGTLLGELVGLAKQKTLASRIESGGLDQPHAMEIVLASIAHPEAMLLEEGPDGVLGALEFGLADTAPAEYVRLWRSLSTGDLVAALAGDGEIDLADLLRSRGATFKGRETPLRLGLESLVGLAHPRSGPNRSGLVMPGGHGLDADVTARVLGHLYGVGVTVAAGATAALRHLERVGDDPSRVPPAYVTLLYDGGERMFVFDHIADGRVFVRAPHGDSTKPRGSRRPEPLRLVEAPERGLESLTMAELEQAIGVALVPRT